MLILANLFGHIEDHPLLESDASIYKELWAILNSCMTGRGYAGFSWDPYEPLQALANLSITDKNKKLILEANFMPLIIQLFEKNPTAERAINYATKTISNLTFSQDVTKEHPKLRDHLTKIAAGSFATAKK